ncbi:MAG: 16S rRNA (guanine(527)-N(7))-methyltransferase RsmG [Candidatus Marinimicrobia bacterium]|nr:16S rRNA (guanine(527)-N(7))-methyltransferase RsmG [Candidatus Neomarinimicrobiota bacterium]
MNLPNATTPEHARQLEAYLDHLFAANRRQNLTRRLDRAQWRDIYFPQALSLSRWLPADARVFDLGSGGGFPAVPLALTRPDLRWLLIESEQAKARFLTELVADLELADRIEIWPHRAETAGQDPAWRGTADAVTVCGVGRLAELVELALPLLRVGGELLALKGTDVSEELTAAAGALTKVGGRWLQTAALPGPATCLRFCKSAPTPAQYPRAPGRPKKSPLR